MSPEKLAVSFNVLNGILSPVVASFGSILRSSLIILIRFLKSSLLGWKIDTYWSIFYWF